MSSTWIARRLAAVGLATALISSLAACSSDDPKKPGAEGSPSESSSGSDKPTYDNYLKVPKGVHLTLRGSKVGLGEPATVAWQPAAKQLAALTIRVTQVQRADIKVLDSWILDKQTKTSQPYFVSVKLRNEGKRNLESLSVPMYAVVTNGDYVQPSSFESEFTPCPSTPLPKKFKPGETIKQCWVFLAPDHGKLTGVSFYPGPWFEPIVWQGNIEKYVPPKKDKKKS